MQHPAEGTCRLRRQDRCRNPEDVSMKRKRDATQLRFLCGPVRRAVSAVCSVKDRH
jgi:hypothetical protein